MGIGQIIFVASFLVLGGLFSVLGIGWFVATKSFLRRAARTEGTVVGHEQRASRDSDGTTSTLFHSIVEFADTAGNTQRVTMAAGSNPIDYAAGSVVPILFDPEKPTDARIECFSHLWLFPLIFTGLGSVAVVAGVVGWVLL
jgi:Protein of unknown function (DUF3592)